MTGLFKWRFRVLVTKPQSVSWAELERRIAAVFPLGASPSNSRGGWFNIRVWGSSRQHAGGRIEAIIKGMNLGAETLGLDWSPQVAVKLVGNEPTMVDWGEGES